MTTSKEPNTSLQHGLVLEGGGLRGMFTNAILDVFMENNIRFDALAGVSAGALFGCNYKSWQPGRGLRYNLRFKDEKGYMSFKSLRETGDFVNADFAFNRLPRELDLFDFETFRNNPMIFYAVCTDIESGETVYHEIDDAETDGLEWLRASSSLPLFANPVFLDGHYYLDGGITDSIPLEFLQKKGYQKNVVIMTQPKGFTKKKAHLKLAIKLSLKQFPKVANLVAERHVMYNRQLAYIESEAAKGNTFVIYPDEKLNIGRVDLDEQKMRTVYDAGIQKANEVMPELKKFLNIE